MAGVSFALADFVTGGPILDLPVMAGAPWASQLNRPDSLSCMLDLNDADIRALDLRSATEPKKTVLLARTDSDVVVAWGLINDDREWDEDAQTLALTATGVRGSWLGHSIIGPSSARTATLVTDGTANPALDTTYSGYSLGTIGKKLLEQRLTWPGATTMPFILPADEVGTHERTYLFPALKMIDSAWNDLTNVENGPDFAIDAQRAADGLHLEYVMRHGSEAEPRIGVHAGLWSLGRQSPITKFKVADNSTDVASAAWLSGGKTAGEVMMSRALNAELIAAGYPPLDFVDTARNDVTQQATLNAYANAAAAYAAAPVRSLSFTVRADAQPGLGQFRPGDVVTIDVPDEHPYLTEDIEVRITSIGSTVEALELTIGCEVIS